MILGNIAAMAALDMTLMMILLNSPSLLSSNDRHPNRHIPIRVVTGEPVNWWIQK